MFSVSCQISFAKNEGVVNLIALLNKSINGIKEVNFPLVYEVLLILIALSQSEEQLLKRILVVAGVLPGVVFLLRANNETLVDLSLKLLINLSLAEENEKRIIESGCLLALIEHFQSSSNQNIQVEAALLLANLSCNETFRTMIRGNGIVPVLCEVLKAKNIGLLLHSVHLIINLSLDDINRLELSDNGVTELLRGLLPFASERLKAALQVAIDNLMVPVSEKIKDSFLEQFSYLGLQIPSPEKETSISSSVSARNNLESSSKASEPSLGKNEIVSERSAPNTQIGGKAQIRRQASLVSAIYNRRGRIVKELLETEKTYLKGLQVFLDLVKNDGEPLRELKSTASEIEDILKINGQFLSELEQRMTHWDPLRTRLGDIVLSLVRKFLFHFAPQFHDLILLGRQETFQSTTPRSLSIMKIQL